MKKKLKVTLRVIGSTRARKKAPGQRKKRAANKLLNFLLLFYYILYIYFMLLLLFFLFQLFIVTTKRCEFYEGLSDGRSPLSLSFSLLSGEKERGLEEIQRPSPAVYFVLCPLNWDWHARTSRVRQHVYIHIYKPGTGRSIGYRMNITNVYVNDIWMSISFYIENVL